MLDGLLLLERLSDRDLTVLAAATGEPGDPAELAGRLRGRPAEVGDLLARPEVFAALFGAPAEDALVLVSPFAAFAVLVERTAGTIGAASFVRERVARRTTVPVFEVEPLREFLDDPLRRLFLADLLASYTHVASGAFWTRGRRGWRRRRFSELDPVQLAEMLLVAPPPERVAIYRRLGDLTLFLGGVFPDYVESHPLPPVAAERLRRALSAPDLPEAGAPPAGLAPGLGAQRLLESAGERAYRLAWAATPEHESGLVPALGYVAGHYRHARTILGVLTDTHLRGLRDRWFPLGGG